MEYERADKTRYEDNDTSEILMPKLDAEKLINSLNHFLEWFLYSKNEK